MNKQEAIKAIASKKNLTQKVVSDVLAGLEEVTISEIKKGRKMQLTGFVTIKPVYRSPRKGFDPLNNVPVDIAESVGLSAKPGEGLRNIAKQLKVDKFRPKNTVKAEATKAEATEEAEA